MAIRQRRLFSLWLFDIVAVTFSQKGGRKHMIDWNKEFPITSITRADLQEAGFTDAQIQTLTDADMQTIAAKMEDMYCDGNYWEDLEIATTMRLEFGNPYGGAS